MLPNHFNTSVVFFKQHFSSFAQTQQVFTFYPKPDIFCAQALFMILLHFSCKSFFCKGPSGRVFFRSRFHIFFYFCKTIAHLGIKNPRPKRGHLLCILLALAAENLFITENQIVYIQPTAVCHIRHHLLSSLLPQIA